ncbi:MAG: EI24 domain-containing protein [Planctomycetes bacterium]|nr:EI24 domain-containing protein [Planctomycetota bacterium]
MLRTLFLAIGQLFDGRILSLLGASVMLSVACFVAVWFGVGWTLTHTELFTTGWLETASDVLGALLTLVLTWFTFPLLAAAFVGLFLEPAARAVEARHYPQLPPAPGLPFWTGLLASLRFLVVVVALNAALLLLWFAPPLYPLGYLLVNGVLLGREYFELVALRRLSPAEAHALRRRNSGELLLLGVGTAGLSMLPVVNFVAPVLVTMMFVHRYQAWAQRAGMDRAGPAQPAGGG